MLLARLALLLPLAAAAQTYLPEGANWQRKPPAEVGMDAARLKAAVEFAIQVETPAPRDLTLNHYQNRRPSSARWKK